MVEYKVLEESSLLAALGSCLRLADWYRLRHMQLFCDSGVEMVLSMCKEAEEVAVV